MIFLAETEARYGFHLIRCRSLHPWRSWCQEMHQPDLANDPAALQAWHNPRTWDYVWRSLTLDAHQAGYGGVFMGMLSSESGTRKRVLRHGWRPTYAVNTGMIHSSPLAHWNKQDIWAYVVAHDLPYNPVYNRLAALGVPLERRRIAALTCFRVMHYGSHVALQQGWPDLYNQLATLFPHVRTYS
jgi:3'-phosphoadenosine 5'-phosphosulfate sulfotransferase (PAPS reductase)/FAD synthetase